MLCAGDRKTTRVHEFNAYLDVLAGLRSLCRRQGQPLSIILFSLDPFGVDDQTRPAALDDRVLRWFSSILASVCRGSDLLSRYPGDRFVVAVPNSGNEEARELTAQCFGATSADAIKIDGRPCRVAVSAGIAESSLGFIETEQQLMQRARTALEQAERSGGDRIVVWRDLHHTKPSAEESQLLTLAGVSHWVKHLRQQIRVTCVESTRALVAAVEAKDPYTEAHSLTVATYAETIGKRMGLQATVIEKLCDAALLHDVGKIGVPDAILTKPGPLTEDEFTVIKRHPGVALDILRHVSFLTDERPFILHHHERFDGKGYPTGLAGRRIPIGARILAVADALDTMLSPRAYKEPYTLDQAKRELRDNASRQFDPGVVNTTLGWLDESPNDLVQAGDRETKPVQSRSH